MSGPQDSRCASCSLSGIRYRRSDRGTRYRGAKDPIWNLGIPISSVGRTISYEIFDIVYARYQKHIDIEDFYNRYRVPISNVYDIEGHISRYRWSRKDSSISSFRIVRYRPNKFRYRNMISYTISKVFSRSISKIHIGVDIVYDITFTQVIHCGAEAPFTQAAGITPAPKGLSTTSPGFLHPLLAQFHSLIHRDLTSKGPSIAPHPHVDFEQPAASPAIGS
jgi:hypothetical protein